MSCLSKETQLQGHKGPEGHSQAGRSRVWLPNCGQIPLLMPEDDPPSPQSTQLKTASSKICSLIALVFLERAWVRNRSSPRTGFAWSDLWSLEAELELPWEPGERWALLELPSSSCWALLSSSQLWFQCEEIPFCSLVLNLTWVGGWTSMCKQNSNLGQCFLDVCWRLPTRKMSPIFHFPCPRAKDDKLEHEK